MDAPSGIASKEQELAKWGLKVGETKVIVEGLVLGTTDEDVWVSEGPRCDVFPRIPNRLLLVVAAGCGC